MLFITYQRLLKAFYSLFSFQVYHTFHDEVNFYKTHIWRCNGICQHRGPFFGYVRRTANRAPGPNDQWWAHHHEQCGGNFLKVSEPDPIAKKRKATAASATKKTSAGAKKTTNNTKIPSWAMPKKTTPTATASRASTIVVRKPVTTKPVQSVQPVQPTDHLTADQTAGRNLSNVVGFKDLNGKLTFIHQPIYCYGNYFFALGTATKPSTNGGTLSPSNGRPLGKSTSSTGQSIASTRSSTSNPLATVRDIWSKKYSVDANKAQQSDSTAGSKPISLTTPVQSNWEIIDDDIEIENVIHETVTILDDSVPIINDSLSAPQRQSFDEASIKREIVSSFGDSDLTDSDIELIDHDYDDTEGAPAEGLCDRTITDNLFSWNKSTEDLNKIHMTDDENVGNPDKELVSCPVCNIKCERESMSDHLDGCLGLTRKIDPRRAVRPPVRGPSRGPSQKNSRPTKVRTSTVTAPTSEEEEFNRRILSEMEAEARNARTSAGAVRNDEATEWSSCPVCKNSVKTSEINDHLDICLSA